MQDGKRMGTKERIFDNHSLLSSTVQCTAVQSRGWGTKGEYLIIIFRFKAQATQSRLSPQTLANKDDDDGDSVNTSRNQERAMVQKIFDLLGD